MSYCLPCPEGRVCRQQGLNDLSKSANCTAGYICGFGTDRTRQFLHKTPGGFYSYAGSSSDEQFSHPCDAGFYCNRGTPSYLAEKNKCRIKYYCPKASPSGSSSENHCPRVTDSLTGSSRLENCRISGVNVCDKKPFDARFPMRDLTYYPTFSYRLLDSNVTTVSFDSSLPLSSEVVTVNTINPVNLSSSSPIWVNESIEAFRACPAFGAANANTSVVIIGRNFLNTTLNFCKWRACIVSNEGIHPWRCKNQISAGPGVPLPVIGKVSMITQITLAKYISPTRMECEVPFFAAGRAATSVESSDEFFAKTNYKCLLLDTSGQVAAAGSVAYVRKCDSVSSCAHKPFSGYEHFSAIRFLCSAYDTSQGLCLNSPELGWMYNPCNTREAIVEVSNDGEFYSGGSDLKGVTIPATVRSSEPGAVLYQNSVDYVVPPTFAVYTYFLPGSYVKNIEAEEMQRKSCLSSFYSEEAPREREQVWYSLESNEAAHVLIDLSHLPPSIVYGEHYRIALFIRPSRCTDTSCNSVRAREVDAELTPCKLPSPISEWFSDASVPKNIVNNITVYALEDLLFKVEIQLLHGSFAAFAPLFSNSATVRVVSPSRMVVQVGLPNEEQRKLSPYISAPQRLSSMKFFLAAIMYESDSAVVRAPLNLPPKYKDFEKGRALIMFNVSEKATDVPVVLDSTSIKDGTVFWQLPAPTSDETKELLDAYAETFHEMKYDANNGYQFTFSTMMLPYLPYVSNCHGFDSYIPFWMLFESTECQLPASYETGWWRYKYPSLPDQDAIDYVGSWEVGGEPIADWCYRTISCNYEEDLAAQDTSPRWFELGTSAVLFHMLRDAVGYNQYTGRASTLPSNQDRGGGAAVKLATVQSEDNIIAVIIDRSEGDAITGCSALCFARSYLFEITYFQFSNHGKRVVAVTLKGSDYDFNTSDTSYTLNASLRPLGYLDLLLNFQFEILLYFILSCAVGIVTVAIAIVTWAVARLTTMLQNPTDLKMREMLPLIAPPALAGATLALIPIWILTSFGNLLVNGYFFSDPLYVSRTVEWFQVTCLCLL